MRCYRCGAVMDERSDICPACGFDIHSPVEIQMCAGMMGAEIYDENGKLLWAGRDSQTAHIDAPERINVHILWKADLETWQSIRNGEAYRFERIRGGPSGFVKLRKTRSLPKR